jgi:hypothetical protein
MASSQQFPTMLGPQKKGFVCQICKENRSYTDWEDAEVYLGNEIQVHMGCLQSHYKELISKATLAHENAISLLQLIEKIDSIEFNQHFLTVGLPILRDIILNLKGALHEQ